MSATVITLLVSLSISVISHTVTILFNRRPRFVVISLGQYLEFKTWHNAQKQILEKKISNYQVFILENKEYTFITSSS